MNSLHPTMDHSASEEGIMLADSMSSCLTRREEELTCPVCCDIFKHPLILPCSHSFCSACLQQWWTTVKQKDCPVCRTDASQSDQPPVNLALKNLSENFLQERSHRSLRDDSKVNTLCDFFDSLQIRPEVNTLCEFFNVLQIQRESTL